jgi:hypothetical protein
MVMPYRVLDIESIKAMVVCGWRKGDVFSVSSPGIFLMLDASRQE